MSWRTRILGLAIAILLLAIAACGGSATATPSASSSSDASSDPTSVPPPEERVLTVAMTFLDEPPDPYQAGWLAVPTGLAETLFKQDESLNTEPWLATGAVQVEPTAWEISLREGVKFHNGALMDAAKVKGSLDLAMLRRPGTRVLLDVDRVEVKNPSTVVIYTNSPIPVLPGLLTNQTPASPTRTPSRPPWTIPRNSRP